MTSSCVEVNSELMASGQNHVFQNRRVLRRGLA
jgi:hypothetical protein